MQQFSGTKEIIFDTAIRLFSLHDYESVNMRELAANCNIKAASIYNHFASKQQIIDTIYSYYIEHFSDNRKSEEEVKKIIISGNKKDILNAIVFTFESDDQKKYHRMILISKIIYKRFFDDERAKAIFLSLMIKEQEEYVEKLMNFGISIGKFIPFDMETFASLLVGCRHIMGMKAFANPDYEVAQLQEEERLNRLFISLLPMKE